jgi:HSP20 family molecular chaperone IbpA
MKKIRMTILLLGFTTLNIWAIVDIEKEINEPVAEMKMLDDAMNKGIKEQRERNENFFLPMDNEKDFFESRMSEFILDGDTYVLEKRADDMNNTTISTEVQNRILAITMTKKIEAVIVENETTLGNTTQSRYFESTVTETLTLPSDADEASLLSTYKDGLLSVTIKKN